MNEIQIIKRALESEDYCQALQDTVAYLQTDNKGLVGLSRIATEVQEAKDNE